MTVYSKPALSISDQIKALEKKGIIFSDEEAKSKAESFFSYNSYYRFSGYTYLFKKHSNRPINFENVFDIYSFDEELRGLLFNEIAKIEISVRTQILNSYAFVHGSHWHIDGKYFKNPQACNEFRTKLEESLNRNKNEPFISHY